MRIEVLERDGVRIVECVDSIADDALGLVTACVENDAPRLRLTSRSLPAVFFDRIPTEASELSNSIRGGVSLGARIR